MTGITCADRVVGTAFGLLPRIFERSGRDARGIGGGAPFGSEIEWSVPFLLFVDSVS